MTKIIGWVFILFFSINQLNAQTTSIPDTAFEAKLIQLGIDSDGLINGQILNSDAVGVTYLNVSGLVSSGNCLTRGNITNLTGIEAFTSLQSLECDHNYLTSLDLSQNLNLSSLTCGCNEITSLDLSTHYSLNYLDCGSNQLSFLGLPIGSSSLFYIACGGNNLTYLDLLGLTNLEYLYCSSNQFSSITNLTSATQLKELVCTNNQLISLDLSVHTQLEYLQAFTNNMTSLDVSNCTALKTLWCGQQPLDSVDLSNNLLLEFLMVNFTPITSLELSANTNLKILQCYNTRLTELNLNNNTALENLDCRFSDLERLYIANSPALGSMKSENNAPDLRICVQDVVAAQAKPQWSKDVGASYVDNCDPEVVKGRVVLDLNQNCVIDSNEHNFSGAMVGFQKGTWQRYFSVYDTIGNYTAYLDTGTYVVTVIPPNPYWNACPTIQQIIIDTLQAVQNIDFTLQPLINCPYLEVDLATPFLRTTSTGSKYTVSYCNTGTVAAPNAYVEVDLDPFLNVLSTSLPVASQSGNQYTFNVGNVGVGECGDFELKVIVDTSAFFQQTHCSEAHIYPDSICLANLWNGPLLNVDAQCQQDTVFFSIQNTGANMPSALQYFVFEDNIMLRTTNYQLANNQSLQVSQAALPGKTYRLSVQQQSGFPAVLGDSLATVFVENCNTVTTGMSVGYGLQFSNGNNSPFVAVDCQQNIGSYDPNDKSAQPVGYGAQHYIYDHTALDYKVRFQNTGTDTAFNVVILDTLSPYLNVSSIEMGASSHAYEWSIVSGNVLRVSFPNILLVDSNTNEALSHGFFRYRINQVANNPLGTVIENSAAIYFDYNLPIITNTVFHTIGDDFVTALITGIEDVLVEDVAVKVYPNPFEEQTTLEVEGGAYQELKLNIYDLMGRVVLYYQSTTNKIQIQRDNLAKGVYIYHLEGDGILINTGKLVVK